MTAYFITAFAVALVAYLLMSHPPRGRHPGASWMRFTAAWLMGVGWPLLSLWAIFYFGGQFGYALWRWVLGEHHRRPSAHNKPAPNVRIDIRA